MVFSLFTYIISLFSFSIDAVCVCMSVCVDNISILQRENVSLRKSKVSRLICFQGSWLFDLLIL